MAVLRPAVDCAGNQLMQAVFQPTVSLVLKVRPDGRAVQCAFTIASSDTDATVKVSPAPAPPPRKSVSRQLFANDDEVGNSIPKSIWPAWTDAEEGLAHGKVQVTRSIQ